MSVLGVNAVGLGRSGATAHRPRERDFAHGERVAIDSIQLQSSDTVLFPGPHPACVSFPPFFLISTSVLLARCLQFSTLQVLTTHRTAQDGSHGGDCHTFLVFASRSLQRARALSSRLCMAVWNECVLLPLPISNVPLMSRAQLSG